MNPLFEWIEWKQQLNDEIRKKLKESTNNRRY